MDVDQTDFYDSEIQSREELKRIFDQIRRLYISDNVARKTAELLGRLRTGFDKEETTKKILEVSGQLEKVKEATIAIELPETEKVHLEDLVNLRSFFSGDIEFPSLENVVVNNCPNIKKFGLGKIEESHLKSMLEMENQVQIDDAKVTYLFEVPRSKKLEAVEIEQCGKIKYLFVLSDLIPDEDGITYGEYFRQIKELKLSELCQLDFIWSDPTKSVDLRNLQILHIKDCSLVAVMSSKTAMTLHQLKELKIEACDNIWHVIFEGDARIVFPALITVEFKSLHEWIRFCKFGHIESPSLKTMIIEECPRLKEFTTGFASSEDYDDEKITKKRGQD